MADQWFSCKGCSTSDPAQDTVKVDPALMLPQTPDKEQLRLVEQQAEKQTLANFSIGQKVCVLRSSGEWSQGAVAEINQAELTVVLEEGGQKKVPMDVVHSHVKPLTAARQKQEEEKVKRLREQTVAAEQERLRQEAKSVADENARRQGLEAARIAEESAAADAADAAAVAAEEERLRQASEKQREQEREAAEVQNAAALAAAQDGVSKWCNQHGFKDATHPKKTFRGSTKFPLHTAVKYSNHDMVEMLLKCGADRSALDSRKQTPGQLAAKMNRNCSHDRVLAIFAQ